MKVGRDGKIMKFAYEIYTRNNISCGYSECETCIKKASYFDFSEEDEKIIFIPDFNVLNQYFDVL